MFLSLKVKLILAFIIVTSLTVMLTVSGAVVLLRDREEEAARERAGQLSRLMATDTESLLRNNYKVDVVVGFLQERAESLRARFVFIDWSNKVIVTDTSGELTGQSTDAVAGLRDLQRASEKGYRWTQQKDVVFFSGYTASLLRFRTDYQVVMIVPESDIAGAWHALLPRIVSSSGVALGAAVVVGFLIALSITKPVEMVTRASEEMAKGKYDTHIEDLGRDEIGRLAASFNDMARQVSTTHRSMRDLVGNVAHELKTPLTSIQGYSQALIDGVVQTPDEQTHAVKVINDEAERMRRLVEDLLYLSRLESGQLTVERAPVRIPQLLQNSAERLHWKLEGTGRELRLQLPVDLPTVMGDERRLEQVVANLLENAERFTPERGRITLSAEWAGSGVRIAVHNSGSYIAPEHQARIFERFYQVDPSRTRDGHHGGLGLAIAREIVQAHGGTLTVESDPTYGTSFFISLPAATAAEPRKGTGSAERGTRSAERGAGHIGAGSGERTTGNGRGNGERAARERDREAGSGERDAAQPADASRTAEWGPPATARKESA